MNPTLKSLRDQAISVSLFRPRTLSQAVQRLGFIQADPIRCPARAQDLILRHRVNNYQVGDLDRKYDHLELEEDRLYAHGFMTASIWRLLHPRVERPLSSAEKRLLEIAGSCTRIHPQDLEVHFGRKLERNAWGGLSRASTRMLHSLHHRGYLRVAGRENGIRVYELASHNGKQLEAPERKRQLILAVTAILQPISESTLKSALSYLAYKATPLQGIRSLVSKLIESGELTSAVIDDIRYVLPTGRAIRDNPSETVRFLSPFDPVVWDRQRFEHFWGWPYRFEAYVPAKKRQLGYYAMPMLWRDDMIGWVNISNAGGILSVEAGFRKTRPKGAAFRTEFDAEVARLEVFLRGRGKS